MQKRDEIANWMKQNHVPSRIVTRYRDYEDCMWDSFRGMREQQILKRLPKGLRMEIRAFIFKGVMQNWRAFPSSS